MKHLMIFMSLILASVGASAFVPPIKPVDIYMTTDTIYLQDRHGDTWITTTDCTYDITEKSDVSILPFDERLRINSRIIVKVDKEKKVCRILKISQMS
jgi:hypothetical protein